MRGENKRVEYVDDIPGDPLPAYGAKGLRSVRIE
jgi:hypothetical protein